MQEIVVKQSMLETIKLIADAVHPDHLGESFTFRSRSELLSLTKSILKSEASLPLSNNIRSLALSAAASLVYPFECFQLNKIIYVACCEAMRFILTFLCTK